MSSIHLDTNVQPLTIVVACLLARSRCIHVVGVRLEDPDASVHLAANIIRTRLRKQLRGLLRLRHTDEGAGHRSHGHLAARAETPQTHGSNEHLKPER